MPVDVDAVAPSGGRHPAVVMVSGSFPPDVCGVGDYTGRLMEAAPAHWTTFVQRDWSTSAMPAVLRRLLTLRPADVVIQYPTQGYGWSVVPHVVAIVGAVLRRYQTTFALHEFSSLSKKAQLALALVSHVTARVIFTTEAERDRARRHPLFSRRVPTAVVGIISNIPLSDTWPRFGARAIDVAYFGHIRPNKGVEAFLDVVQVLRAERPDVRIAIVGEVPAGYEAFGEMVAARFAAIGGDLILGLDDQAAARMLRDIRVLYLPFPDGVSARRGTALAGMGNGAIVATRIGAATSQALRAAVIPCDGTPRDVTVLIEALAMSDEKAATFGAEGRRYITTTLPRDWSHVVALYEHALGHTNARAC